MVEAAGVEQVFHSIESITYALSMGYKFLKSPECRGVGTSLVQILFLVQNQALPRRFHRLVQIWYVDFRSVIALR